MNRYTNVYVGRRINISSTFHYTATVWYSENGKSRKVYYDVGDDSFFSVEHGNLKDVKLPHYIHVQVMRRLLVWHNKVDGIAHGCVFVERDQDGNERVRVQGNIARNGEKLRYYDAERWARYMAKIEQELKKMEEA